jgi:HEPN domain-containing protein
MMARSYDVWLEQAVHDLQSAITLKKDERHDWACYLCAQASEKALKALLLYLGKNPGHTHSLNTLVKNLLDAGLELEDSNTIKRAARSLTKIEAGTRYPLGEDAPRSLYGNEDSDEAVQYAKGFVELAVDRLRAKTLDEYVAEIDQRAEQESADQPPSR